MQKVTILMTTYNGGCYLRKQLDSILNQTFENWNLYISDDGSSDDTLDILREYSFNDNRIEVVNLGKKQGTFINYFNLIKYLKQKHVESDFYAYCDQDDIWLNTKLEVQMNRLNQEESNIPVLCYTNLAIMDEKDNLTGENIDKYADISLNHAYNLFFKHRYIWGTTVLHNKVLWDMLIIPDDVNNQISHDNYLAKYAVSYGKILYEQSPLLYYRRHENNVSGMPREHMISRDCNIFYFIKYYSFIVYPTLYFIQNAPYQTEAMKEYEEAILAGKGKMMHFLNKYKINVTSGRISTLIFKMIYWNKIYMLKKETRDLFKTRNV